MAGEMAVQPLGDNGIRVMVVDDHDIVREGLSALLAAQDGIVVVGSATDGVDAVLTARQSEPDVVIMDIQMPRLNGIEATRQIVAARPGTRVVMLTMNEDDDTIMSAIAAGARGYLLKGSNAAEVMRAVRTAAGGGLVFGAQLAERVAAHLAGQSPGQRGRSEPSSASGPFGHLTDRERSVLELLAAGRSNNDIARATYLSAKTVRNVVSSIYAKLGAEDRAAAIIMAREAGLGRGD